MPKHLILIFSVGLMMTTGIGLYQFDSHFSSSTEPIKLEDTNLFTQQNPGEKKCTISRGAGRRDDCSSESLTQLTRLDMMQDPLIS
jgi:hypothetical protein